MRTLKFFRVFSPIVWALLLTGAPAQASTHSESVQAVRQTVEAIRQTRSCSKLMDALFAARLGFAGVLSLFSLPAGAERFPVPSERPHYTLASASEIEADNPAARFTVALEMYEDHKLVGFCSGVLIDEQAVVTDAHCIHNDLHGFHADTAFIIFNRNVSQALDHEVQKSGRIVLHEKWQKSVEGGTHDIALIELLSPPPAPYAKAPLLPPSIKLRVNDLTIQAGYGDTRGGAFDRGVLRTSIGRILGRYSATEMLTGMTGEGVCLGDSGGPSFVQLQNDVYVWGLNVGNTHDTCRELSASTLLSAHQGWIDTVLSQWKTRPFQGYRK